MEGKWIKFVLKEQKTKTSVYSVIAKEGDINLGEIKWFPKFRKYSFYPTADTVFEITCLNDICNFIEKLTNERKEKRLSIKQAFK